MLADRLLPGLHVIERLRTGFDPSADELAFVRAEFRLAIRGHIITVDHVPQQALFQRLRNDRFLRLAAAAESAATLWPRQPPRTQAPTTD